MDFFLDLYIKDPSNFEKELVSHIFLKQAKNESLYIHQIPEKRLILILEQIINSSQPKFWQPKKKCNSYLFCKWNAISILSRILNENKYQISDSFYLNALESIRSSDATSIHQAITKNSPINDKQAQSICQSLSFLFEKHHGLFVALQKYLDELITRIGPKSIFNYFKLNSFALRDKFDKNLLQFFEVNLVDSSNFAQFWGNYQILFAEDASTLFQSLFTCATPFPKKTKYMPNEDNILSLANDVISKKKKHFVDIILIHCRTLIIDGLFNQNQNDSFLLYTNDFPELRPLTVLSEFESLKNDINVLTEVTAKFVNESSHPIISNFMRRIYNDNEICSFLQASTGRVTFPNDLIPTSLPKYMSIQTNQIFETDILSAINKDFFVISDQDRNMDVDFISSYQILSTFILSIEKPDINMDHLDEFFSAIKSKAVFNDLIIDVYSVLFLQTNDCNNNLKYVFSKDEMAKIVKILNYFHPTNKYIRQALIRLNFSELLDNKNFEEAKDLAESEEDPLFKIAQMAEIVDKISKNQPTAFPQNFNHLLFATEYFLSLNDMQIDFENYDYKTIIDKRIYANKIKSSLQIDSHENKKIDFERNNKIHLSLFDMETNNEILDILNNDIRSNNIDLKGLPLLKGFVDIVRLSNYAVDQNLDLKDFISYIVQTDETSALLKATTVPEKYKGNKIVNAIVYGMPSKNISLNNNDMVSINEILDYLDQCDNNFIIIPNNVISLIISKLLTILFDKNQKNSNPDEKIYDVLNSLYFRNPDISISLYNHFITKFSIRDLMNLLPYSFNSSISGLKSSNLTLIEELNELITNKMFIKAKKIADEFNLNQELEVIIQKTATENDLTDITLLFPNLHDFVNKMKIKLQSKQDESNYIDINELKEITELDDKLSNSSISRSNESLLKLFKSLLSAFNSVKEKVPYISTPLMSKIQALTTSFISLIKVDSLDSESIAAYMLSRLVKLMNRFKVHIANLSDASLFESYFMRLENLSQFVSCNFYALYNEEYTMEGFIHRQQGAEYAELCQKYDRINLLRDIQSLWGLDQRYFNSSILCFNLGLINKGINELKNSFNAHKSLNIDCCPVTDDLLRSLSYPQPLPINQFYEEITLNGAPLEISISDILKSSKSSGLTILSQKLQKNNIELKVPSLNNAVQKALSNPDCLVILNSPQLAGLVSSLSIIGADEERIQFHCKSSQFDEAFEIFMKMAKSEKLSIFLRVLVTPALAFSHWNVFWRKILKYTEFFTPLFRELIQFLKKNHMFYCLFDIQRRINYFDNSILAAIKLFGLATSWKERQEILSDVKRLISKSLTDTEKKDHMPSFSDEALLKMQQRVNLQLSIISFMIHRNVLYDPNLELMTSKKNTLLLGSFLLLNLQVGYFSEICELPDVNINEVCDVAVDKLQSSGEGKIPQFFRDLTRLEFITYSKIVFSLIQSIYSRVTDQKSFIEFVKRNIRGDDLIAKILQKYGFEKEAAQALKNRNQK